MQVLRGYVRMIVEVKSKYFHRKPGSQPSKDRNADYVNGVTEIPSRCDESLPGSLSSRPHLECLTTVTV